MLLSHVYMNILKKNRKSSVGVTRLLDPGDKIMITSDFSKFARISKYSGSGSLHNPENYFFVDLVNSSKLSNLFSSSRGKSVFKVSVIENNYPSSGYLKYAIHKDVENIKDSFSKFGDNKRVIGLLKSAIENDPQSTFSCGDEKFDFDKITKSYDEYRVKSLEARNNSFDLFKREVYEAVLLYSKIYNINSKYLGI